MICLGTVAAMRGVGLVVVCALVLACVAPSGGELWGD